MSVEDIIQDTANKHIIEKYRMYQLGYRLGYCNKRPKYSGFNKIIQVCVRGCNSFCLFCCALPSVLPSPLWSHMAHLSISLLTGRGKKKMGRHTSFLLRIKPRNCMSFLSTFLKPESWSCSHSCLRIYLKLQMFCFSHIVI